MLSAQKVASILDALVLAGNVETSQQFFKCCGPNWQKVYSLLSPEAQKSLNPDVSHQIKIDPKIAVKVFNELASAQQYDTIIMMCNSRIGNIGRIMNFCSPDAVRVISRVRQTWQKNVQITCT